MYSVLLFLLVVILAPIALRSLLALLISPLFWGLLILGGLWLGGLFLYEREQDAKSVATEKARQIEIQRQTHANIFAELYERSRRWHKYLGDGPFNASYDLGRYGNLVVEFDNFSPLGAISKTLQKVI
jgi:hypothetical protein